MSPPRLLVPGLLEVVALDGRRGHLDVGPLADIAPCEPAHEDPATWAFVPREGATLRPDLDLASFPRVAAQLERVRWRWVTPDQVPDHGPALWLTAGRLDGRFRDNAGQERSFEAEQPAMWRLAFGDEPPADDEVPPLHDRCVRALSGGAVSLRDVELARWALGLAPDTLPIEEEILEEIHERAAGQREPATAVVQAIDALTGEAGPCPVYGTIRRLACPAFSLADGAGVQVVGGPIEVPSAYGYLVDGVEPWEPGAAVRRRAASFADWQGQVRRARDVGRRRERRLWLLIAVILVVGIGILVAGQLALSQLAAAPVTDTDLLELER